jgi:hypothetical protein
MFLAIGVGFLVAAAWYLTSCDSFNAPERDRCEYVLAKVSSRAVGFIGTVLSLAGVWAAIRTWIARRAKRIEEANP